MLIFCKSFYRQEEFKKMSGFLTLEKMDCVVSNVPPPLAQSPVCVSMSCDKLTTTSLTTKAKGTEDSSGCFREFIIVEEKKVMCEREERKEKNQQEERNEAQCSSSPVT